LCIEPGESEEEAGGEFGPGKPTQIPRPEPMLAERRPGPRRVPARKRHTTGLGYIAVHPAGSPAPTFSGLFPRRALSNGPFGTLSSPVGTARSARGHGVRTGAMQDPGCELPRTPLLLGTRVNKQTQSLVSNVYDGVRSGGAGIVPRRGLSARYRFD
jgi:hypothetical protein